MQLNLARGSCCSITRNWHVDRMLMQTTTAGYTSCPFFPLPSQSVVFFFFLYSISGLHSLLIISQSEHVRVRLKAARPAGTHVHTSPHLWSLIWIRCKVGFWRRRRRPAGLSRTFWQRRLHSSITHSIWFTPRALQVDSWCSSEVPYVSNSTSPCCCNDYIYQTATVWVTTLLHFHPKPVPTFEIKTRSGLQTVWNYWKLTRMDECQAGWQENGL